MKTGDINAGLRGYGSAARILATTLACVLGAMACRTPGRNSGRVPLAPGEARTIEIATGVTMEFRWIPPTTGREWRALNGGADTFLMGSPADEEGREPGEGPQTRVRLTEGFWIGTFPVTQLQWTAVMGYNPSRFREAGPDAPVERVSWNDVHVFIRRIHEHVAAPSPSTRLVFRLPTEAEWEYACRAGTTTPFHFGDALDASLANFEGGSPYGGGPEGEDRASTVAVGSFPPNAWGLHDMHGNVWEWCLDPCVDRLPGGVVTDPVAETRARARALRGGSWFGSARLCRSAYRSARQPPDARLETIGFRLVMTESPDARTAGNQTDRETP